MTINYCGAKTRAGGSCKRPSGWGTEHVGEGRCKLHGGNAGRPIIHGRYSKHLPRRILDKAEAFKEGDPLDIFDELATQRALFVEYASRFDDGVKMTVQDVSVLMEFTSEIMRSVERVVKMRNETKLTGAEVALLQTRAVDVAMKYFDDPETRKRFIRDLFGLENTSGDGARLPHIIGTDASE